MTQAEKYLKIAAVFERKANEAAASDKPWALGNLRLYQRLMVENIKLASKAA